MLKISWWQRWRRRINNCCIRISSIPTIIRVIGSQRLNFKWLLVLGKMKIQYKAGMSGQRKIWCRGAVLSECQWRKSCTIWIPPSLQAIQSPQIKSNEKNTTTTHLINRTFYSKWSDNKTFSNNKPNVKYTHSSCWYLNSKNAYKLASNKTTLKCRWNW